MIRIFGKSRWSGASSPNGEVAISSVDWSQRLRVLPMTGRVPLSRHVRTPWGAESIGRSRATDWEFESVVRARTASCVESPSRMTSQRGESGLFGNRSGIADRSGFGVTSNRGRLSRLESMGSNAWLSPREVQEIEGTRRGRCDACSNRSESYSRFRGLESRRSHHRLAPLPPVASLVPSALGCPFRAL